MTEPAQLKAELEAVMRLGELTTRLLGCRDLSAALEEVLDAAIELTAAQMGNVQLLTAGGDALEIVVQHGFEGDFLEHFRSVTAGEGSACARTMAQRERMIVEDIRRDPGFAAHLDVMEAAGCRAVQSTPLVSRSGDLLGVLSTHYTRPFQPSALSLRMLDLYARQAADFIDHKKQEAALRESEARHLATLESITDAFLCIDADGRFSYVNEAGERVCGMSRAEVLGRRFEEVFPGAMGAPLERAHREAVGEHPPMELENDFERSGRWYSIRPHPRADGGFTVYVCDITARRRAEEELRHRGEQFETLIERAPLGVYLVDDDLRIAQVNHVARPVFGNIPDLIGRDFEEVIRILWEEPYADEVARLFRRTLETGESYETPECAESRADRSLVEYYSWRIDRITLPNGRYGVVCYFSDISEQVRARQAISTSERKYRTLFESIDEGFCTLDMIFDDAGVPVDYRFVECNAAFERHTGLKDAVGRTVREFLPEQDREWFEIYGRVAMTGESVRVSRYGEALKRWFEVFAFRIGEPEERRVAALFADVTLQKNAERALQASEERQAFLLELTDALRPLADPGAIRAEASRILGEHLGVNRAVYAEVHGEEWVIERPYEHGVERQAAGRHPIPQFGEWIVADFRAGKQLIIRDVQTDPRFEPSQRAAHETYHILGAVAVPLVKEGRLVAILVVHSVTPRDWSAHDIALVQDTADRTWAAVEQVRVEAALRESEAKLRTIIEQAPLAIAMTGPGGEILLRNPRFDQLWGRPAHVTTARTYSEVYEGYHLDGRRLESEEWPGARALLKGEMIENEVYEIVQANGNRIACWFGAVPFRSSSGEIQGAIVVFRDVTAERRTEEALIRAREEAEAANAAKDSFLAMVSHELRTPLNPALMMVELLEEDPRLQESLRSDLHVIARNIRLEARLIDDLLDLTRAARGLLALEQHELDPAGAIEDAVRYCQDELHAKQQKLYVEAPAGQRVLADETRLRQILWNLLRNASKFAPEGGEIALRCRTDESGKVMLEITDSGVGIEPGMLQRVFEPFEQEDAKGGLTGGLGLGLTIARVLTEAHGGEIQAHSEGKGRGSTFRVVLPSVPASAADRAGPASLRATPASRGLASAPAGARIGRRRVLLVEDHEETARLLDRILSSGQWEVFRASNATEARRLAEQIEFDLLISDIGLPDEDGWVLRRRLGESRRFASIALSGYGSEADLRRSREAGFDAHLIKPISREDLLPHLGIAD